MVELFGVVWSEGCRAAEACARPSYQGVTQRQLPNNHYRGCTGTGACAKASYKGQWYTETAATNWKALISHTHPPINLVLITSTQSEVALHRVTWL